MPYNKTGVRRCRTCLEYLPQEAFAGHLARRCNDCWAQIRNARCVRCDEPAGVSTSGKPREFCEPCRRANLVEVRLARGRKPLPSHRECPVCARRKPLTEEHFSIDERDPDGKPIAFHRYCRSCKAAEQRDRYHNDPQFRQQTLERNARQRAKTRQRAAADPDFAQRRREYHREHSRRFRERRRQQPEPFRSDDGGGMLPVEPLADAIRRELEHLTERDFCDAPLEVVAAICGTTDRTIRAWLASERIEVRLNIADRALIGLNLLWFEVWDPADYPDAARLWEPVAT